MYNYTMEALVAILAIISIFEFGIIEHQSNTIETLKAKIDYIVWGRGEKK